MQLYQKIEMMVNLKGVDDEKNSIVIAIYY
jgi:hypothetical protein